MLLKFQCSDRANGCNAENPVTLTVPTVEFTAAENIGLKDLLPWQREGSKSYRVLLWHAVSIPVRQSDFVIGKLF